MFCAWNQFWAAAFAPEEDGPAAAPLAVLSHGFWQRRFGGQASVIGQRISISGTHHEIIGVLPQDFAFRTGGSTCSLRFGPNIAAAISMS